MQELSVLSLGAGVQSSVLALLIEEGVIMPQLSGDLCAIFADTGWEPDEVYNHLDWLETQLSFPVYRVMGGSLKQDLIRGIPYYGYKPWISIPAHSWGTERNKPIMRMRQCTYKYKIEPLDRQIRKVMGIRAISKNVAIEKMLGISTDEVHRMKPNKYEPIIHHRFPLIEMGWSRTDCLNYFKGRFPERELVKSACLGCPYHSDTEWQRIKVEMPEEFEETCEIDEIMRNTFPGEYLHRSLKPLREVDFAKGKSPDLMGEECEGMCGI